MYVNRPSCASRLFKPYEQLLADKVRNHRQPNL